MTIRSVCSSYGMNPQQEHHSETFLSSVQAGISDLKDDQRFVTVMVDKIHMKPYFDYEEYTTGVALSKNEAASCALAHFYGAQPDVQIQRSCAHLASAQARRGVPPQDTQRCDLQAGEDRVPGVCVVSDNNSVNITAVSLFDLT